MSLTLSRANLLSAIIYCIYLTDTTVKMAIELAFLLDEFAWLFAFCTIIFLFYRIISRFRKRSTGRSPKGLNILHGVFLGLLAAVCGAEWSLYVGYMVRTNGVNYTWRITWHWMQCARQIVFWIASLEVVIWALIVTVRTSRIDRQARVRHAQSESQVQTRLTSVHTGIRNLLCALKHRLFRHELDVRDHHHPVGHYRISGVLRLFFHPAMASLLPDHLSRSLPCGHLFRAHAMLLSFGRSP